MLNNELLLRMLTGNLIARAKYSRFAGVEEENRRETKIMGGTESRQEKKGKTKLYYTV